MIPAAVDLHVAPVQNDALYAQLHGICGWFRGRLSPGVVLHNEPPSVGSSWAHAFFPLQNAAGVLAGDEISIRIETADDGAAWRWRTHVTRAGRTVAQYDQTNASGYPAERAAHQGVPPHGR